MRHAGGPITPLHQSGAKIVHLPRVLFRFLAGHEYFRVGHKPLDLHGKKTFRGRKDGICGKIEVAVRKIRPASQSATDVEQEQRSDFRVER